MLSDGVSILWQFNSSGMKQVYHYSKVIGLKPPKSQESKIHRGVMFVQRTTNFTLLILGLVRPMGNSKSITWLPLGQL